MSLIAIGLIIMAGVNPASAGLWDNAKESIQQIMSGLNGGDTSQNKATGATISQQVMVMDRVRALSTPENIQMMNSEMERYGITSVRVDVEDTGERFYLVKDYGYLVSYNGDVDVTVVCTSDDIQEVVERVEDGRLGILERIEIMNMMRNKVQSSRVKANMFDFCLAGGLSA